MVTKRDVFTRYLGEYLQATKARKGEILNTVTEVTGLHRQAAIRKFRVLHFQDPNASRRRGRRPTYGHDVTAALEEVWATSSEVCGELLHPMIAEYVACLRRDGLWAHGEETTRQLLRLSEGTIKDRVGRFRKARQRRGGWGTTSPSRLKVIIPIFTGPWQGALPGMSQIDTVVHCGSSLLGDLVYTLNNTDVATLWVVPVGQWNKGQRATVTSMQTIKERLPFPWLSAHPDTGSEFINYLVKGWCDQENLIMTRSRPHHKNDNAYVEERNGHVVRKFLGYARLDCPAVVPVLNEGYTALGVYLNHFVPVRKCIGKERVGSRYRRRYDRAQTPYHRVLAHPAIAEDVKKKLRAEHETLNPLLLKREVDRLIAKVFATQKNCGDPSHRSCLR